MLDFTGFPQLAASRRLSVERLDRLSDVLDCAALEDVAVVAVSGSLGRLESTRNSDVDLIIVLRDGVGRRSESALRAYFEQVWTCVASCGLPRPMTGGIFTSAVSWEALCTCETQGELFESPTVFGKRMQLLLDARPVLGANQHLQLVQNVLARYQVRLPGVWPWTYLLHDLMRYYHGMSVGALWKDHRSPRHWQVAQVKLQFSRRVMVFSLLCVLAEFGCDESAPLLPVLARRLSETPLERIANIYARHGDQGFERVLADYNTFLTHLEGEFGCLLEPNTSTLQPRDEQVYWQLIRRGHELSQELKRFASGRGGDWSAVLSLLW